MGSYFVCFDFIVKRMIWIGVGMFENFYCLVWMVVENLWIVGKEWISYEWLVNMLGVMLVGVGG